MSADNFSGQNISSTFQRLLQLSDNGNGITDGTGSIVQFLPVTAAYVQGGGGGPESDPIFVAKSASLATTGSNIFRGNQVVTGSLITSGGLGNIDTAQAKLYDNLGTTSIDWNNYTLSDQGGIAIDWNNHILYADDLSGINTASVDWNNRLLKNVSGLNTLKWDRQVLYDPTSNNDSVDWYSRYLVDSNGSTALEWNNGNINNGVRLYGTASYALNTSIDTSSFATTGSNIFKGNQTITGSVSITGSFGLDVHANPPTDPPTRAGLFYFTSNALYISLD